MRATPAVRPAMHRPAARSRRALRCTVATAAACEIATDLMFRTRPALLELLPDLFDHSLRAMSAEDALRFLGRKPHGRYQGDTTADLKRRPEGRRVKFRMSATPSRCATRGASCVSRRPSTTRASSRSCARCRDRCGGCPWPREWPTSGASTKSASRPTLASSRFSRTPSTHTRRSPRSTACAVVEPSGTSASRPSINPVSLDDARLFAATLDGRHLINGFRNGDLAVRLDPHPSHGAAGVRRRRERTSRLIAKLRAHGLVAKVSRSRLYRVTPLGHRVMGAPIYYCRLSFPRSYAAPEPLAA